MVESGTAAVDSDLFIPTVGEIDMLGVRSGRLILACVFDELEGRHLKQLPDIYRWVRENSKLLAHVYRAKGLSEGFSFSIWYLCAAVEPDAQLMLPPLSDIPLVIYCYRPNGGTLAIERFTGKPKKNVIEIPTNLNLELNENELGEFLATDDEITCT